MILIESGFMSALFQSLIASEIYGLGSKALDAKFKCVEFNKRYKRAFEKAVSRFYADPDYAGDESRRHYADYLKMLQEPSTQEDILSSSNHIYKELFDLFTQEVSKDRFLFCYSVLRSSFTTQKKLGEIGEQINVLIGLTQSNRENSQKEHHLLEEQIKGLERIVTNPNIRTLTIAHLNGSAVSVDENKWQHIVPRREMVEKCVNYLDEGKLLILYGALKVGKTTLAQLIVRERADVKIKVGIARNELEANVIDLLSNQNNGSKYIIISDSLLSKGLSTIDFSLVEQVEVPLLSFDETSELIDTYNPTANFYHFIYGHTSGHPVLVKTLCSHFSSCGWRLDEDNFSDILNYSFDRNLIRAFSDLIGSLIPDGETRILLNRIMLINGSFTDVEALQLADVSPQIVEPRRRFYSLIPTWITNDGGRFRLSPLMNKLWRADLSLECQQQCYKILSKNILSPGRPLAEQDIMNYINYSVRAKDYDEAAHMYIVVLNKLHDANETLPKESLLRGVWIDLPLPLEMSLKARIGFRLAQLLLLDDVPKSKRQYLLWDLKQLVESYEDDDLKAFFYSSVVLLCLQEDDVAEGLRFYVKYRTLDKKGGTDYLSQVGEQISLFDSNIWLFLLSLTTVEEFEGWLDTFYSANIEYSHSDRRVCDCCYLSVTRLIMNHMRGCKIEEKRSSLLRLLGKSEQCNCPELAIVSIFEIADLMASEGDFYGSKALYETHYNKYKEYPLAEILLNGVMAFSCYKSRHIENENMCYFERVLGLADRELIPSIQLHVQELYSYVIAESDPKQSITILNEALAYSSDESHRVDVFEYYQCKGELSYAYWCIGDNINALKHLSESVDFVLPLAESGKLFAKTYLCLCNCLITKYICDMQNKPLPEGQAVPERGMFTENNLTGLDDLYSADRQYVTCYYMSDLCDLLTEKAMAYDWAKKAVEACRKRGEVLEPHYLLFLLLPLFSADNDLEDIAFIIRHADKARRLTYDKRPEMKQGRIDLEFVEYLITPLLMEALVLKARGIDSGLELVQSIIKDYDAVVDIETTEQVKSVFERDTYDRTLISETNKLNVQEKYCVYICSYLLTAYYSDNDYAFDLLMALMPELQKQLTNIYGSRVMLIFNRFISSFWKVRIIKNEGEFVDYTHLKEKGLELIDEYEGKTNQANKTMLVVSNHLKYEHKLNRIQEDWLYT